MRMTRLHMPTLKEDPSDAEVISHKLMLRAGMIRKLTSGVYSYLPLGYRSLRKVEQVVREEMDAAGALEVFLPMVQPSELWIESGRWAVYGPELLRFTDRHDRECCLGPTHEEVITDLVRRDVRSYRDLPLNLYQIQTKFRDEIRPRFGLMRGREFIMKDGYSFDISDEAAETSYENMREAYKRVFTRCGLAFKAVEADSGPIGGSFSHEFMVLADTGEDVVVSCDSCDYAANMEKAQVHAPTAAQNESEETMSKVATPNARSIEEICAFLNVPAAAIIKTLILMTENGPVVVLLRGDHELNDVKVKNYLGIQDLQLAADAVIEEVTGASRGFSGPLNLKNVRILADNAVAAMETAVLGANEADAHITGVNPTRDVTVSAFGDFRLAVEGDTCPKCQGRLQLTRGIEVGHIFKLGTKYSQAMNARFLDADGKEQLMVMGCYGIGVSRVLAAAIEQNHDEDGIIFPAALAPYTVVITPLGAKNEDIDAASERLYSQFLEAGIDTLLDDRDERPGVKFKDADLIGIPYRVTVGKKALAQGKAELRDRRTKTTTLVPKDDVVDAVKIALADAQTVGA